MAEPQDSTPALGDDYFARLSQPLSSDNPLDPQGLPQRQRELSLGESILDAPRSVLAGVASMAEGLAEVGNILPGVDYDLEFNQGIFRDAETGLGSFIQTGTQFLVGFTGVGAVGSALSKVGTVSRLGRASQIARAASARRVAGAASQSASLKARQILERAAAIQGRTSQFKRGVYLKDMAQGAAADFLMFSEDEQRLSNLLLDNPSLDGNLVLEFLAQDDEDSALESRLKASLEGAGLGLAAGAVFKVIKGLWNRGQIVKKAKSESEALELLEQNEAFIEEAAEDGLGGAPLVDDVAPSRSADEAAEEAVEGAADEVAPAPLSEAAQQLQAKADAYEAKLIEKHGSLGGASAAQRKRLRDMRHAVEDADLKEPLTELELMQRRAQDYEAELIERRGSLEKATAGERRYLKQLQNKAKTRSASEGMSVDQPTPFGEESYRQSRPETARVQASAEDAVAYGGISVERARELVRAADEAFEAGDDILETRHEAIPGVLNLAMLGSESNKKFLVSYLNDVDIRNGVDEFGKPLPPEQIGRGATPDRPRGRGAEVSFLDAQAAEASLLFLERALGRSPQEITAALRKMAQGQREISTMYAAAGKYIDNFISDMDLLRQAAAGRDITLPTGKKMSNAEFLASQNLKNQDAAALAFADAREAFGELLTSFGAPRREMGRAFYAMRQRSAAIATPEFIEARLKAMGGRGRVLNDADAIMKLRREVGSSAAVAKIINFDKKARMAAMTNELFVNNILYAPVTMTVNLFGNLASAVYGPMETLLGASVARAGRALRGADTTALAEEMHRAVDELMQLASHFGTAAAFARKALKQGDYILDPGKGTLDLPDYMQRSIGARNVGYVLGRDLDPEKGAGALVELLGSFVRIPSAGLMSTDEFFKQWTYRASVSSDLMALGRRKLAAGEIDNVDRFVERELRALTRRGQALTRRNLQAEAAMRFRPDDPKYKEAVFPLDAMQADRDAWMRKQMSSPDGVQRGVLAERALDKARERTFTNDLDPEGGFLSTVGIKTQEIASKHPLLRLMVPFIRTPMNILLYANRRIAIPGLNKDLHQAAEYMMKTQAGSKGLDRVKSKVAMQLASKDPRVQADVMGRMSAAMGFSTLALSMASSGVITGGGPKNKDQRKLLEQTGWQPYSIKVGDTYLSYQKMDPFATMIAVWADIIDAGRYAPEEESDNLFAISLGAVAALADNIQSKSYLQGLVQASGLLTDPEKSLGKTLGRVGSAFVPASSLAGAIRRVADPELREVRGPLDQIINRIPFMSDSLDPQRNIFGEAVNMKTIRGGARKAVDAAGLFLPIMINSTTDDVVALEIAELGYPFSNPSRFKYAKDLGDIKNNKGQSAYDRWMELTGTVTLGRGSRRTLKSALKRLIQSSRYQNLPETGVSELDVQSPRVELIQQLLTRYRAAALRQMLREFPELEQASRAQRLARIGLRKNQSPDAIRNQLFPLE